MDNRGLFGSTGFLISDLDGFNRKSQTIPNNTSKVIVSTPTPPPSTVKHSKKNKRPSTVSRDYHTKIIASLVPDEIIYYLHDKSIRKYNVALLLGDVSGFTDLCEKYNKTGKGGPSRLTEILNGYLGSMVQEILSANGDVLKFSGDAFLAWWKSTPEKSIQDVVNAAVDCALLIQKNYGRYETDIQVTLKVKLAIAAGQVMFSVIGEEKMKHYIIVGQPIFDVKLAEYLCNSGDVMISPTAWQYMNILDYVHEVMPDREHIKVKSGAAWKNIQNPGLHSIRSSTLVDHALASMKDDTDEELFRLDFAEDTFEGIKRSRSEEYSLRPSVNVAAKMKMKEPLRPFIFPPVMKGVDLDEPLEYLTEMRQVVIMFVNVITTHPEMTRLISVVDQAYRAVCMLVDESRGSVNKVSMFDKDLMFLVVFGLRGYKHDLESQSGLRCAADVYNALTMIKDINVVSVGVTTGMTYCGVVGHMLRREYTVIGIPVNKAARLMIAYPGRVTCDRETFLHSQMDSRHFLLQEPKELKGLASVGPIYQYLEETKSDSIEKHTVCRFPLLSRDKELALFSDLLDRILVRNKNRRDEKRDFDEDTKLSKSRRKSTSALLIQGDPRQGKSRLLDEMVYSAPRADVRINRIALTHQDRRAPYSCMQLIFAPALGFLSNATVKEKEDRLNQKLAAFKTPQLLCCLNNVFNISFDMSQEYLGYNLVQRETILQSMMKKLVFKCFKQVWVVAIDDCEFIDDDSWKLMSIVIEQDCVLFLMTLGHRREISTEAAAVCNAHWVTKLVLPGIDKWYHVGLACQMLDVKAIPPELEKEIHARSNGNPGWVENYLVGMLQAGGLTMHYVLKEELKTLGLVVAPNEMLMRVGQPESDEEDPNIDEMDSEEEDYRGDGWKMYQFSYNESVLQLLAAKNKKTKRVRKMSSQTTMRVRNQVQVCKLSHNFNMANVNAELTMDVMVIKIFDSLSSYEQMLLKSASVLGETFPRTMLEALLVNPDHRLTCLAVKHMFEIHVLGCAEGDFNRSPNFLAFQQRVTNPNMDQGIQCTCQGILIDKACEDLPPYAVCGYIRFRTTLFRDTTYSLLTNVQKKELHLKAVMFLERDTMRCESCGGDRFVNILANQHSGDKPKEPRSRKTKLKIDKENALLTQTTGDRQLRRNPHLVSGESVTHIKREEIMLAKYYKQDSEDLSQPMSQLPLNELNSRRRFCGLLPAYGQASGLVFSSNRSLISLTRSFSTINFTNCQCSLILTTMYTQLLEHCRKSADVSLVMDAILEYASVCIVASNIPQAMRLLDEALDLLASKPKVEEEHGYEVIPNWKTPFIMGKIHSLLGYALLVLGQMEDAYKRLFLAMIEFGHPFPTSQFGIRSQCKYQMIKLKMRLNYWSQLSSHSGNTTGFKASMAEHMSDCLSLMCSLFKMKQQWQLAHLAAVWGLNKALQAPHNFFSVCTAYSNMMDVAHHYGDVDISWRLETSALKVCNRVVSVQSQEVEAVARLYLAVFTSRLHRGEIEHAANLGFKTIRITTTIHAMHIRLQILPPLIQALTMRCRMAEAVSLLQELEFAAEEDSDKSARTWYYALAVDLQLDTGFSVIPFRKCEQFFQEEGEKMTTIRDPDSKHRYFTNMWLWCVRNEEWEAATVWSPHARHEQKLTEESITSVMTLLRLAEGLLLYMVGKVDIRNIKAVSETYLEITALMNRISRATKVSRLALPRYMHMKAYYRQIRYHDPTALKILSDAKLTAQKQGNLQEAAWAEHSEKAWKGTLPPILQDFWREHCDPDNLMDWHEADMSTGKMVMFSLPTPRYNTGI